MKRRIVSGLLCMVILLTATSISLAAGTPTDAEKPLAIAFTNPTQENNDVTFDVVLKNSAAAEAVHVSLIDLHLTVTGTIVSFTESGSSGVQAETAAGTVRLYRTELATTLTVPANGEVVLGKLKITPDAQGKITLAQAEGATNDGIVAPGEQSSLLRAVEPAEYTVTGSGVTVSGVAMGWNGTDDTVFRLYPATLADTEIKSDIKLENPAKGTAVTEKGTPAASDNRFAQIFRFSAVAAGEYKLAIYKPGKYVLKIIAVTVETTAVKLGEQKLWLYGDVNYDGKVNTADGTAIYRKYAGQSSAFDLQTDPDVLIAADINVDGAINTADGTAAYRYYAGLSSALDALQ